MARRSFLVRSAPVVAAALAAAACGTRLPSRAFTTTTSSAPRVATGGATTSTGGNPASDVGVTADEVRVGLIVSRTSPLGAETFSGPMYGARAYFDGLNLRGGVHGRKVKVIVCDDGSTGAGNRTCVRKLIDHDKVFAFAGNSIFQYAGAPYVSQQGVPDVGGQPIGNAYDQYQHLYNIYGTDVPRDGKVGFDGKLYGGTEVYRWVKEALGAKTAGVVSYNQSDSQRFAAYTEQGLRVEGFSVVPEQVDFAVPNWDAVAADMKAHHVEVVFDALDTTGNVRLCRAMDAANMKVKAKVLTVQSWGESVRSDYSASPTCRNSLYATANDLNYMDTRYPVVAQFRGDMRRSFPDRADRLSMWEEEGWASAQWLTDAMSSCGAQLTRACVEAYMNRPVPYDGHGLLTPRNFVVNQHPGGTEHNCLNVAQWQDAAFGGKGGWVTKTPDMQHTCYDVPSIAYSP